MTNTRAPGGKGNVVSVVRTGGTLATFLVPQGTGAPAAVPDSVADRQDRKLRAGAAG
ncbi:MAG: hypothetical protein HOY69_00215 [Streptomyces sp.]|nr:hypothetical protein [Streptomyces sp.]